MNNVVMVTPEQIEEIYRIYDVLRNRMNSWQEDNAGVAEFYRAQVAVIEKIMDIIGVSFQ